MDDIGWDMLADAIGDCEFPDGSILAHVQTGLAIYEIISMVLKFLNYFLDKVDDYILYCLKGFENLKNSNKKISILWSVANYKYCYANSGTGYRYGWHIMGVKKSGYKF